MKNPSIEAMKSFLRKAGTPVHYQTAIKYKHKFPDTFCRHFLKWQYVNEYDTPTAIHYLYKNNESELLKGSRLTELNLPFDPTTVYPTSNDDLPKDLGKTTTGRPQILTTTGTVMSLDVLANLRPDVIFFVDPNPNQLIYLNLLIKLIIENDSRIAFLANLFGREKSGIEKIIEKIDRSKSLNDREVLSIENKFWEISKSPEPLSRVHESFLDYDVVTQNKQKVGVAFEEFGKDVVGDLRVFTSLILNEMDFIDSLQYFHAIMPIYRKDGFLSSEEAYQNVRETLSDNDWIMFPRVINSDLIHQILMEYSYYEHHLWLSNILGHNYFWSHIQPQLADKIWYLKHTVDESHNIQVWEDNRSPFFKNSYDKRLRTSHWDAFSIVNKHREGKTIELVNEEAQIESSTHLSNTTKIVYYDLNKYINNANTIFFHILLGHGMSFDKFAYLLDTCLSKNKKLIILEHNSKSNDFSDGKGISPEKIIEKFGEPNEYEYTMGKKSKNRNFVMVYG